LQSVPNLKVSNDKEEELNTELYAGKKGWEMMEIIVENAGKMLCIYWEILASTYI